MERDKIITKSDFTAGMTCPKLLWYKKNRKDLMPESDTSRAEEGKRVGEMARGLFPGVVIASGSTMDEKVTKTRELLAKGASAIAEAAFLADGLYCQVDVLLRNGDAFDINEVKAVTSVRTDKGVLKEEYLYDAGFQHYVATKAGLAVSKVNIIHLDKGYVRKGELDITKLFVTDEVTKETDRWAIDDDQVMENAERIRYYLEANVDEPDESAMNTHCAKIADHCLMRERCMAQLDCCDVWNLNGTFCKPSTKLKLFREGIVSFEEIKASGRLRSDAVKIHLDAEVTGKDHVDKDAIREFLGTIWYPIAYLDFETYKMAVPEHDGQWPYEQIPFQYSLDIAMRPGDNLEHREFLGDENKDPRRELAERLIRDIPKDSCVIVYNDSFEKTRLSELSELFPDLAPELDEIRENVRDIMIPFFKADYYTKAMKHSYSIKKVLPALYPEDPSLDYSKLPGVQNGHEAMNRFIELRNMSEEEREREREGMLRYCGLDTYAMVKVHEALADAAK